MRTRKLCALLAAVLLTVFVLSATAFAKTGLKTVRVGYVTMEGYYEVDSDGIRSGYGYEYLQEMAKYTNWSYEYISGTWDECLARLERGEIDFLAPAQYSKERAALFDFSSESMGTSYTRLNARKDDERFASGDYAALNGTRIGLLSGNYCNVTLEEFAAENGFIYETETFSTQEELDAALRDGKVDLMIVSSLRKLGAERVVAQFAPSPFYSIVRKGNSELLKKVNYSIAQIEMNTPAFYYQLYSKYYGTGMGETFNLTKDEQAYLASKPTVRVGMRPQSAPLSSWDKGGYKGIVPDYAAYLFQDLGMNVVYVNAPTPMESIEMLGRSEVDILCTMEHDYNLAERYNARLTTPYLQSNFSIVTMRSNSNYIGSFALVEGTLFGERYVRARYPEAARVYVANSRDAARQVALGAVDAAILNIYTAEYTLNEFPTLHTSYIRDMSQQFSLAVSNNTDPLLYSILDKKINSVPLEVMDGIVADNTIFREEDLTLWQFAQRNPTMIMNVVTAIFIAAILVMLYVLRINRVHADRTFTLAYIDSMTGMWNSNGYLKNAREMVGKRHDTAFAAVRVDLTRFADVNERFGRELGDMVIINMAKKIREFCGDQTITAHLSADGFVLLMPYKEIGELKASLEKLAEMLSTHEISDLKLNFAVNIGIGPVTDSEHGEWNVVLAMDHAEAAHSACKATHDTVVLYSGSLYEKEKREKAIIDGLERALTGKELRVYFQPKYDMRDGSIMGAEALVRWRHSELGFLTPDEFIPLLERSGRVTDVDFYVLECACGVVRGWLDEGLPVFPISVNQSRAHFEKSDYIERLREIRQRYRLPEKVIELEITETLFSENGVSGELIQTMREAGYLVSVDDFGSGYSSLYLLNQVEVDVLKLDRSLLIANEKEGKVKIVVGKIVEMARALEMIVICEGVETKEQTEFLLDLGCRFAQGYYYCKPLSLKLFEQLVRGNKPTDEAEVLCQSELV